MLHFNRKNSTYKTFFRQLSDTLQTSDVATQLLESQNLIFGSDEEKAIVRALKSAFPVAPHIFCSRHIEENVRRHMTDSGIVTSEREKVRALLKACFRTDTTNNSIAGSEALSTLSLSPNTFVSLIDV